MATKLRRSFLQQAGAKGICQIGGGGRGGGVRQTRGHHIIRLHQEFFADIKTMVNIPAGRLALRHSGKLKASARAVPGSNHCQKSPTFISTQRFTQFPRKGEKSKQQSPWLIIGSTPRLQCFGGGGGNNGRKMLNQNKRVILKQKNKKACLLFVCLFVCLFEISVAFF